MLAITGKDKISIITKLEVYQIYGRYEIRYNNAETYAVYETKEEAMQEFITLSNNLKAEKLKIITDKLEELNEMMDYETKIQEKEK